MGDLNIKSEDDVIAPSMVNAISTNYSQGVPDAALFPFLHLSCALRDIVYEQIFPRAKIIHVTEGHRHNCSGIYTFLPSMVIEHRDVDQPEIYRWSPYATNLMCSCRLVHNEIKAMIFKTNTFIITQGRQDHPLRFKVHPYDNIEFWFDRMPHATKNMVKKLHVHLNDACFHLRFKGIAEALSQFSNIEITIGDLSGKFHDVDLRYLEPLCRGIIEARSQNRPIVWNDGGDTAVTRMLNSINGRLAMSTLATTATLEDRAAKARKDPPIPGNLGTLAKKGSCNR